MRAVKARGGKIMHRSERLYIKGAASITARQRIRRRRSQVAACLATKDCTGTPQGVNLASALRGFCGNAIRTECRVLCKKRQDVETSIREHND